MAEPHWVETGMFEPYQVPAKFTRDQFLAFLTDVQAVVAAGDSMDGSLTYTWADEPHTYWVAAAIRIGNRDGQGGLIIIGKTNPQ